jgi:hypothetical protein
VVDRVHVAADLPRTPNGKVDRPALVRRHTDLLTRRAERRLAPMDVTSIPGPVRAERPQPDPVTASTADKENS